MHRGRRPTPTRVLRLGARRRTTTERTIQGVYTRGVDLLDVQLVLARSPMPRPRWWDERSLTVCRCTLHGALRAMEHGKLREGGCAPLAPHPVPAAALGDGAMGTDALQVAYKFKSSAHNMKKKSGGAIEVVAIVSVQKPRKRTNRGRRRPRREHRDSRRAAAPPPNAQQKERAHEKCSLPRAQLHARARRGRGGGGGEDFRKHVNCAHRGADSRTTNCGAPPQGEQVILKRYARVQK